VSVADAVLVPGANVAVAESVVRLPTSEAVAVFVPGENVAVAAMVEARLANAAVAVLVPGANVAVAASTVAWLLNAAVAVLVPGENVAVAESVDEPDVSDDVAVNVLTAGEPAPPTHIPKKESIPPWTVVSVAVAASVVGPPLNATFAV